MGEKLNDPQSFPFEMIFKLLYQSLNQWSHGRLSLYQINYDKIWFFQSDTSAFRYRLVFRLQNLSQQNQRAVFKAFDRPVVGSQGHR